MHREPENQVLNYSANCNCTPHENSLQLYKSQLFFLFVCLIHKPMPCIRGRLLPHENSLQIYNNSQLFFLFVCLIHKPISCIRERLLPHENSLGIYNVTIILIPLLNLHKSMSCSRGSQSGLHIGARSQFVSLS